MSDLLTRLQSVVGQTYRVEKELGGGGMSRVFLAEETRLGRKVVIKVLPPEMAAGVNVERFEREIVLAAKLQHPHIVPLLTAGADGDLLYYVMPYIAGESLRARLAREGELPIGEVVRVLRGVLDALAFAHAQGVVHRDIKPDNILQTGKHAVVTDFGVAKAVSASTGESSITSLGVALGTPAYMAPEQAAADPNVDHRADIYAVGALTYEMLCGRPPFGGATPQAVLSAHVTQVPDPVTDHRPAVPPALSALVMRCLEKHAADRWQSAEELLTQAEAMVTPSGGLTPTGAQPVSSGTEAALRRHHPVRVAALFGVGAAAVLVLAYFLMIQIGLPGWVFPAATLLLAVGFPITMLTGHLERRRLAARTTGAVATPTGVHPLLTWRRALLGGGVAFGGFIVLVGGFMAMRSLGIGPVGTLVASGALEAQAPIVLADFTDRTGDSTLAGAVAQLLEVDLSQSSVITLLPSGDLAAALERMRRDPTAPLDAGTAREVAVREGAGAVLEGEINRAGSGYLLSAQLVEPISGNVLAAFRETARDENDVIDAIERLSRSMLERIGESYKDIRDAPPLNRVTTASLAALRRYSQGIQAEKVGDWDRALDLFREAVAIDSTFAMAHRKISVVLSNSFGSLAEDVFHATRAYELRDRLPELERYQTTLYYFASVDYNHDRALSVGFSGLEEYPDDGTLNTTTAYLLNQVGRFEEAERLAGRGRSYGASSYNNEMVARIGQGRFAAADSTLAEFEAAFPNHPLAGFFRLFRANAQRAFDTVAGGLQEMTRPGVPVPFREGASWWSAVTAETQGRLGRAERFYREAQRLGVERGLPDHYLNGAVAIGMVSLRYREQPQAALRIVEDALRQYPLDSLHPFNRPYTGLAEFYALAGDAGRARLLLDAYEREVPEGLRRANPQRLEAHAAVALAGRRLADGIALLRQRVATPDPNLCPLCGTYKLAAAYDEAGETDSAAAVWERAVEDAVRQPPVFADAYFLPRAYQRLGEIHEQRGDRDRAIDYYTRFVELWAEADDELQPVVRDVRARIARLTGER